MAMKDIPNTEKNIARALTLDPDSTWNNFFMGRFYDELKGDNTQALIYYKKADQLAGGSYTEAQTRIGEIYLRTGQTSAARSLASELSRRDPNNASVQSFVAKVK